MADRIRIVAATCNDCGMELTHVAPTGSPDREPLPVEVDILWLQRAVREDGARCMQCRGQVRFATEPVDEPTESPEPDASQSLW